MAAKKAGVISINLEAGTAKFLVDMDRANAKVGEFGRRVVEANQHGVSEMKATAAAVKTLEGNFTSNTRAVDAFLEKIAGAGPLFQAAFPVVGAIAFAGIIVKIGQEVDEFFEKLRTAPERMATAFRELNDPLRLTNDELLVSNERLKLSIAKLEGKTQNTLALALAEARVAADRLADSLDKDLDRLSKLLKEQEVGRVKAFFTGQASTVGDTRRNEEFVKEFTKLDFEGSESVRQATTKEEAARRQNEWNQKALRLLDEEIEKRRTLLEQSEREAKVRAGTATAEERAQFRKERNIPQSSITPLTSSTRDQTLILEERRDAIRNLEYLRDRYSLTSANIALTQKDDALRASAANAKLDRPFEDRIKAMDAQLSGLKAKMAAVGQGEEAEISAKAFADASKAIDEVNKALERMQSKLTPAQEAQLRERQLVIATAEADLAWKVKLDSTNDSIQDRIRSLDLLTAAIGKGYEATKRASVETSVMGAVGPGRYNDEKWMLAHADEITALREKLGGQFDVQAKEQTTKAVEALNRQVESERSLAAAQTLGADAVRQAALANRIREITLNGARTATGELTTETRQQIAAEIALAAAQRSNVAAADVARLTQQASAIRSITAAMVEGSEAERKAALEAKYQDLARTLGTAASPVIEAQRKVDDAEEQRKAQAEALKTTLVYRNQMETIDLERQALERIIPTEANRLVVAQALRELENQRLRVLIEQMLALRNMREENLHLQAEIALQMGTAREGVRAFFLEMQRQAKTTAYIIEEALGSALDRVSGNLAKLLTGQRTAWGQMFRDIGEQMVKDTIKSTIQVGLGKLGGALGITKADGSRSNPFYVVISGGGIGLPGTGRIGDLAPNGDTIAGVGVAPGGLAGILGKIFGRRQPENVMLGNGGILGTGQAPVERPAEAAAPALGASVGGAPDGSIGNPFYVILSRMGAGFANDALNLGANTAKPAAAQGSVWGDLLKAAIGAAGGIKFGGGGAQAAQATEVTSSISYSGIPERAGGGPVSRGRKYVVGERGPEIFHSGPVSRMLDGAREKGGPVGRGKRYLVGEKGPEIFHAPADGHIVDHETTKRMIAAPIRARADGGDISAGSTYLVGERGPEAFIPGMAADQASRRTGGSGPVAYYTIDARGTDPLLVEQRVKASLIAVHGSAVATSIQGVNERNRRTPRGY
jgi:hypothetical protein